MGVKLQSALGGSVELNAPSTASNFTMTVPTTNGTVATTDQVMGMKNAIINGSMLINQRNVTVTTDLVPGGTATDLSVDRWKSYGFNATGNFDAVLTTQQFSDHPTLGANGKCLRVLVTTADTVTPGTDFFVLRQDIEAANSFHFYGNSLSLSFWVKTSTVGTYGVQLRAVGTTDGLASPNFIATYTVSAANTWEYKTISIPPQTLSTTRSDNGSGYTLYMTLVSGQTETSPGNSAIGNCINQWGRYSSDGIASSAMSNTLTAATNRYFQLTEVQLELGGAATPFERRSIATELALCKRYFNVIPRINIPSGNGLAGSRLLLPPTGDYRAQPSALLSSAYGLEDGVAAVNPSWVMNTNQGVGYTANVDYSRTNSAYSVYVQLSAEL